jgi:hypothetical protein
LVDSNNQLRTSTGCKVYKNVTKTQKLEENYIFTLHFNFTKPEQKLDRIGVDKRFTERNVHEQVLGRFYINSH